MRPLALTASMAGFGTICCFAPVRSQAAPPQHPQITSVTSTWVDRVVDDEDAPPVPAKVLHDTVWIADWTFDVFGGGCTEAGWEKIDGFVRNDGSNFWSINGNFSGTGGIVNQAAVLAKHDLSWVRDGYGNDWDYSIILMYQGPSALTFSYLSDSEPGFDFVSVEADSAGASESRVDFSSYEPPFFFAEHYRTTLMETDGIQNATIGPLALPDFGVPAAIHELYIRFVSDGGYSDQDGLYPTFWHAGLVVDNIVVTGGLAYSEDFEGTLNANLTFANTASTTPFGEWGRLYPHITDNDKCTENTTCAWLWSDPTLPALSTDMEFGPGGSVVRSWLDNTIVSPWVSLTNSTNATSTILSYRRFPGNDYLRGGIIQNWSVRAKVRIDNTDTPVSGDSIDATHPWRHSSSWNSLGQYQWITSIADMSPYVDEGAIEIQARFRLTDRRFIFNPPLYDPNPGPGPYVDRVRIGRWILSGPVIDVGIDTRSQAQDCFATVQNSITPGEHFSPSTDRFGTCALSSGEDLAAGTSANLVTGDSINIESVRDVRGAGGVTAVRWYGAITQGPHAGKAPVPYTVGANGFFEVTPDSARNASGAVVDGAWFVDLDDTYFRGGDQLLYFWTATDAGGGRSSAPEGITAVNFPPASVAEAERAVDGLFEVSFLPAITWSPSYLSRIAADSHGDLDPTPGERAESEQRRNCLLYSNQSNPARRSGGTQRTSFTWALDKLGYFGHYDTYDVQGYGNTNNQLAGRATIEQCTGYALIIQDTGRGAFPSLPDGSDFMMQKVDQATWYRTWLAQGLTSEAGIANLWLIGEDLASEKATSPLLAVDCGLAAIVDDQGNDLNPMVRGQSNFMFSNGNIGGFSADTFSLHGGCPEIRDYDGAASSGTAVVTHRYTDLRGNGSGPGATVMNKNTSSKWNTVWMGFNWFDVNVAFGTNPTSVSGGPARRLLRKVLNAVLPGGCIEIEILPFTASDPGIDSVPTASKLHPNVPNPFNPATTIAFDLARDGRVQLRIYDVAGRLVKTLVDGEMTRGFGKTVAWSGLDETGTRVASGVYLCRLTTDEATANRKIILLQ